MFLKFLDDMERIEEAKAEIAGKSYRGAIVAHIDGAIGRPKRGESPAQTSSLSWFPMWLFALTALRGRGYSPISGIYVVATEHAAGRM
jgi:hypothetical protein